jgi:hypothetical protein
MTMACAEAKSVWRNLLEVNPRDCLLVIVEKRKQLRTIEVSTSAKLSEQRQPYLVLGIQKKGQEGKDCSVASWRHVKNERLAGQ